jgi:hypothetical protein
VDFYYYILYGEANYTIDLQIGFDYNDIGPGETPLDAFGVSGETSYGAAVHTSNGPNNASMHTTLPDGLYWAAVRVTDNNSDQSVYIWPDQVHLTPQFSCVVLDDPQSQAPSNRDVSKLVSDLEFLYGSGTVDTIDLSLGNLAPNDLDGYDLIAWPSDRGTYTGGWPVYNTPTFWTRGSGNPGANIVEVHRAHDAGSSVLLVGQYAIINTQYADNINPGPLRRISAQQDSGSYSLYWFGSVPGIAGGQGSRFRGSALSVPNSLGSTGGFRNYEASYVGWRCPGVFHLGTGGSQYLKSGQQSATYRNGYWFSAGYSTSYSASSWVIHRTTEARLVTLPENWGDLSATQLNGVSRSRVLENCLCAGEVGSVFNSPNT